MSLVHTSLAPARCRRRPASTRRIALGAALVISGLLVGARARATGEVGISTYLATAEQYAGQMDHLRFAAVVGAPEVAKLLEPGLAALAEADELLVEQERDASRSADPREAVRRCQLAFARGELYRRAAAVLPQDAPERGRHLDQAIAVFQTLRLDHMKLAMGQLGYIGEARALRLRGDPAGSYRVLQPVLDLTARAGDQTAIEVRRLALLEQLETHLATGETSKAGSAASRALRSEPVFRNAPLWRGRVAWVAARAAAVDAQRLARGRTSAEALAAAIGNAAAQLRDELLVEAIAEPDRLSVLAALDGLSPEPVMTAAERLTWAPVLAAVGRHAEAVASYERGLAGAGASPPAESLVAYGALLRHQGDPAAAANVFARALAPGSTADADLRVRLLQWHATCLLEALAKRPKDAPDQSLVEKTLAATWEVVQSAASDEVRRDMLRRWVAIQSRLKATLACRGALSEYEDLAGDDPYLCYMSALADWQFLQASLEPAVEPTGAAVALARQVARNLAEAEAAAEGQGSAELAAMSALLRGQVLAGAPLGDAQAALRVLEASGQALTACPATRGPAAQLRVALLLELGMVDQAKEALAAGAGSARLALEVAEALAQRYGHAEADTRGQSQAGVISLCNRAVAQSIRDGGDYQRIALDAVAALLQVDAYADGKHLLDPLLVSLSRDGDSGRIIEAALLNAAALRGSGEADRAAAALEPMVERFAASAELRLALARCRVAQGEPQRALDSFREARKLSVPGSDLWWRATLGVTETLHAGDQQRAADEVLRVAVAIHRPPRDATLRLDVRRLQRQMVPNQGSHTVNPRLGVSADGQRQVD